MNDRKFFMFGLFAKRISLLLLLCLILSNSSFARLYHVSVSSDGVAGNEDIFNFELSQISGNGRFVTFVGDANNLVPNDNNNLIDIFVHDLLDLTTTRVNLGPDNTEAGNGSHRPSISDDGRYVVFTSFAPNLVVGDNNNVQDIFVRDRQMEITTRVSVNSNEEEANGKSDFGKISPDGRYVIFASEATNLEEFDVADHGPRQYYVRDLLAGTTTMVSKWSDDKPMTNTFEWTDLNSQRPMVDISLNGNHIAFTACSGIFNNFICYRSIYWRDLNTDITKLVTHKIGEPNTPANGFAREPSLTNDGQKLAFGYYYLEGGDPLVDELTNTQATVHIYDVANNMMSVIGESDFVNINAFNESHSPELSGDGKHLSFHAVDGEINSNPMDLTIEEEDAFVKHLEENPNPTNIDLVSTDNQNMQMAGFSWAGSISSDGQAISFQNEGHIGPFIQAFVKAPCLPSFKASMSQYGNYDSFLLPLNVEVTSEIIVGDAHGCVDSLGIHPKFSSTDMDYFLGLKIELETPDGTNILIKDVGQGTHPNGSWTLFDLDLRIEGTWTIKVTNTSDRFLRTNLNQWRLLFNPPILQGISLP